MKPNTENIKDLLNETSLHFFNKNDIKEFSTFAENNKIDNVSLIEYSNLLVTFALKKLDDKRFCVFLNEIAKHFANAGELKISISIYKSIINFVKNRNELINQKTEAYFALAELYSQIAEWELSNKYLKSAEKNFKAVNNYKGLAKVENLNGIIEGDRGNVIKSQKHFQKSLLLLERDEDVFLKGKILINLGIIANILGNFDSAIHYYEIALSTFENKNNYKLAAELKHNIGMLYLKKREYNFAIEKFDESIADSLKSNSLQHLGISYLSKADAYSRIGELEIADTFAKKSLEISNKINDRLSIAESYKIKGIIQRERNNFESAENYLLTSLRINDELGNKLNKAETAYELGILYKEIRKNEESKKYFNDALSYYKKINAIYEVKQIKTYLPN